MNKIENIKRVECFTAEFEMDDPLAQYIFMKGVLIVRILWQNGIQSG